MPPRRDRPAARPGALIHRPAPTSGAHNGRRRPGTIAAVGTRWTPTVSAALATLAVTCVLAGTACSSTSGTVDAQDAPDPTVVARPTTTTSATDATTPPTTTTPATTTPATTTPATTTASTVAASTTTSPSPSIEPQPSPTFDATDAAFDTLALANTAVSMTVVRDGAPVLRRASGVTIDGEPATTDSPMVVASVSKLLTALAVGRLAEQQLLALDEPVAWQQLGLTPDPGWNDVTARELLDHTSGMPVARSSWFVGGDVCWTYLPMLMNEPPAPHRGKWTYSNGNYCALGLLVGAITHETLDDATQRLLLEPVGASGLHLTTDGQLPTDVAYAYGVERLSRLGGAGTFMVSTDDVASVLAATTPQDQVTLTWPAIMLDQYGWGHTGTVDGAKSCAWVLESGRTVIVTTVAGSAPSTGGAVCDLTVPAIAADLGFEAGTPHRTPR